MNLDELIRRLAACPDPLVSSWAKKFRTLEDVFIGLTGSDVRG